VISIMPSQLGVPSINHPQPLPAFLDWGINFISLSLWIIRLETNQVDRSL